jgi:hypothetical protein
MASKSLPFRVTKDVDMVLVLEVLTADFVEQFWAFIKAGEYRERQKSERKREYYRFSKPQKNDCPAVIELFSRQVDKVKLDQRQVITPIPMDEDISSLSAILMNDEYYNLVKSTRTIMGDLPVITADGLVPLKAKAWLDLTERKKKGESIDEEDVRKHMKDVFKLAATLTDPVCILHDVIKGDLQQFVDSFPEESIEWKAIMTSMGESGMPGIKPEDIIGTLVQHFKLKTGTDGGTVNNKFVVA